jgi:hypothetical protein
MPPDPRHPRPANENDHELEWLICLASAQQARQPELEREAQQRRKDPRRDRER